MSAARLAAAVVLTLMLSACGSTGADVATGTAASPVRDSSSSSASPSSTPPASAPGPEIAPGRITATPPNATASPSTANGAPLGRLTWGDAPDSRPWSADAIRARVRADASGDLARQVRRVLQVAEETLGEPVPVVATIDREGVLATDARYRASDEALRNIDRPFQWATCARLADLPLADRCARKAAEALDAWSGTYRPSGNPINDSYLVPVLQALDLTEQGGTSQRRAWEAWARAFAERGDAFYAPLSPTDGRIPNNWGSWRLYLRALGSSVGRDEAMRASTAALTTVHVARNLRPSGSSIDFEERDALHYHVYDLEPLVGIAMATPDLLDAPSTRLVSGGLQFLRPYVTREQAHVEFVRSTVRFDYERRNAGIGGFANAPWDPREARNLLRLARTRFAEVRPWTADLVDEQYSPRLKLIAALRGG